MTLQLYFPKPGELLYPFFTIPISAGEARNIEQTVEWISLDEFVKANNYATYYLKVDGDSMIGVGIYDGALLVVERRESAESGEIVVAEINGEFTVKEYKEQKRNLFLVPANGNYQTRKITKTDDFKIWGVVSYIVQKPQKRN